MASYNFHWYLTPSTYSSSQRLQWGERHKTLQLVLCGTGGLGSLYYFWLLRIHWFALSGAAFLTFLYSAPKLPHRFFQWLSKIAVGKTLFLTFVWTYVTAVLPIVLANEPFRLPMLLFILHRFFLIYAICILFDYRDREHDKLEGIRSLVLYLNEAQLSLLFYASVFITIITAVALLPFGIPWIYVCFLCVPPLLTAAMKNYAQRNASDYLYYFVLDGLMMLAGLLTAACQWN